MIARYARGVRSRHAINVPLVVREETHQRLIIVALRIGSRWLKCHNLPECPSVGYLLSIGNLLVESILCGLHGLYAASIAVLRLLVEFSILQLYYRNVCSARRSFLPLEDYFKSRITPSWSRALRRALPEDAFCRPIRARLELHHKSLSSAATHPHTTLTSHRGRDEVERYGRSSFPDPSPSVRRRSFQR